MKVILLHDVAKIGRRHTVVEVPDGFARNRLIPMKAAVPATTDNLARYKSQREHAEGEKKQRAEGLAGSLKALAEVTVTVTAEANDKGHLFQAVSKDAIVDAVAAQGVTVIAGDLHIPSPIKSVGEHTVEAKSGAVSGSFVITVVAK